MHSLSTQKGSHFLIFTVMLIVVNFVVMSFSVYKMVQIRITDSAAKAEYLAQAQASFDSISPFGENIDGYYYYLWRMSDDTLTTINIGGQYWGNRTGIGDGNVEMYWNGQTGIKDDDIENMGDRKSPKRDTLIKVMNERLYSMLDLDDIE